MRSLLKSNDLRNQIMVLLTLIVAAFGIAFLGLLLGTMTTGG
jgi:hypothetical protein